MSSSNSVGIESRVVRSCIEAFGTDVWERAWEMAVEIAMKVDVVSLPPRMKKGGGGEYPGTYAFVEAVRSG